MSAHSHASSVHQELEKNEIMQAFVHGANNNNKQQNQHLIFSIWLPNAIVIMLLQTHMETCEDTDSRTFFQTHSITISAVNPKTCAVDKLSR